MPKPRVVFDTNVFVSGLIAERGPTAQAIDLWRHRQIRLIVSAAIVAEILDVLHRPALLEKQSISEATVAQLEKLLSRKRVTAYTVPRQHFHVCRDPDDNKFLDAAVSARVQFLVTNDQDLLDLREFHDVRIINVREFLTFLG